MHTRGVAVALLMLSAPLALAGCAMGFAPNSGRYNEFPSGETTGPIVAEAAVGYTGPTPAGELLAKAVAEGAAAEAGPAIGGQPAQSAVQRKLIRDAALVIGVASREEAGRSAAKVAERLGGYVQEATTRGVLLRVPADRFEAALEELAKLGLVSDRKVQVRDVTEEYVDLELRLKSKRAMLARLEALAAKAEKIEDLLKVEQELSRLTLEIEQLEGKLRLLASQTTLSRIAVEFVESAQAARGRASPRLPFWWLQGLGLSNLVN